MTINNDQEINKALMIEFNILKKFIICCIEVEKNIDGTIEVIILLKIYVKDLKKLLQTIK